LANSGDVWRVMCALRASGVAIFTLVAYQRGVSCCVSAGARQRTHQAALPRRSTYQGGGRGSWRLAAVAAALRVVINSLSWRRVAWRALLHARQISACCAALNRVRVDVALRLCGRASEKTSWSSISAFIVYDRGRTASGIAGTWRQRRAVAAHQTATLLRAGFGKNGAKRRQRRLTAYDGIGAVLLATSAADA